jgi:hypothetical protein
VKKSPASRGPSHFVVTCVAAICPTLGAGLVENNEVHDFLNIRCLTIAGSTEQILLTMPGERLLGLPR